MERYNRITVATQLRAASRQLAQIGHLFAGLHDLMQQIQPVAAQDLVVGIDLHRLEECVDGTAQRGHVAHGCGEILGLQRRRDPGGCGFKRSEKRPPPPGFSAEFRVGAETVLDAILLLGLGQDIGRTAIALHEVLALGRPEKVLQRAGAGHDEREIIDRRLRQCGVDHVMGDVFGAEMDL